MQGNMAVWKPVHGFRQTGLEIRKKVKINIMVVGLEREQCLRRLSTRNLQYLVHQKSALPFLWCSRISEQRSTCKVGPATHHGLRQVSIPKGRGTQSQNHEFFLDIQLIQSRF